MQNKMDDGIGTAPRGNKYQTEWQESILITEHKNIPQKEKSIKYYEICSTGSSICMRAITILINIYLALSYYQKGSYNYFLWTTGCILIPMIITMLIHANMCLQDGNLKKESYFHTCMTLLLSFLFRYLKSFRYAITCKQAERKGDLETQTKFYALTMREESDVAFIRIFDCFLEAAPQKILQISIVLSLSEDMSNNQILAICSYFVSMAWCLSGYHRYIRYSQIDKHNMIFQGFVLQLCWHFCVSVSRTLCIAFVASLFPFWTLVGCGIHAIVSGIWILLVDRPKFFTFSIGNFLFCLLMGIVYIFTYITARDGRTRNKYIIYYILNSLENIACVAVFIMYSDSSMQTAKYFYPLCILGIAFYCIGICCMIMYYMCFHPKITARSTKMISNNK